MTGTGQLRCVLLFSLLMSLSGPCHRASTAKLDEKKKGDAKIVFCTVHAQCTHSARYSARHSARPQNTVNTTYFPKNNQESQKNKYFYNFCKLSTKRQSHRIYSVLWPCTVECTVPCTARALYVHCAKHSECNSASGGVEAHSLFVGSSCEDERVFGLGLWHVQKGICSSLRLHSHKQKNIASLFAG